MTQEEIIRMAREAGMTVFVIESLERFAALVAAHEREKFSDMYDKGIRDAERRCTRAIESAVLAEREACAKVCDDLLHWAASCCAKDIRAREE